MTLLVEMGWGGLVQAPDTITWTDITSYVDMVHGVTITRGASDELSETQPGTATLSLDNQDGRFTPGNVGSPYSPFVRRNAPIRVTVAVPTARTGVAPWPAAMLSDDFDNATLDPVLWSASYGGVVEVGGRARIPCTTGYAGLQSGRQWTLAGSQVSAKLSTVPAASTATTATVAFMANSTTAGVRAGFSFDAVGGTLRCTNDTAYWETGATVLPYSAIDHAWLRLREAAGTLYWETSSTGYPWDFTVQRSLATPAWVTAQTLVVEVTTHRDAGTADVAEVDLFGHRLYPRFYGMVNEFPVAWTGLMSTVTISATDLFKRLNRMPVLRSCLAEEILLSGPLAYYPLTEPDDSTSGGDLSGTTAGTLGIVQAGTGGTLAFGSGTGPAATGDSLPVLTPVSTSAGKYLSADLGPDFQAASANEWNRMEVWFSTSTAGRVIFAVASPDGQNQLVWSLSAAGVLQAEHTNDGTALTVTAAATANLADGKLHHLAYDEQANDVYVDGVFVSIADIASQFFLRTLWVGGYKGTRLWSGSIGHLALYAGDPGAIDLHYEAGDTAFAGDLASERIERLVRYTGLQGATIYGATHDPVAGQGPGGTSAMARMREVETTEAAKLLAARDWYGIDYASRDLRYNPDPLDEVFVIAYADLEPGVALADDDQKLINTVDASRPGGATQRVTAPESVFAFGPYEQSLSVLKMTDNSALDAANWLVSRYADPPVELREVPIEAYTHPLYTDILDADISGYFSVTGLPVQAPSATLRVTVEGYTETIRNGSHLIQFHTSRSATDSVWVLDDATYSALGSTTRLAY
jgi:hypothetical protein